MEQNFVWARRPRYPLLCVEEALGIFKHGRKSLWLDLRHRLEDKFPIHPLLRESPFRREKKVIRRGPLVWICQNDHFNSTHQIFLRHPSSFVLDTDNLIVLNSTQFPSLLNLRLTLHHHCQWECQHIYIMLRQPKTYLKVPLLP